MCCVCATIGVELFYGFLTLCAKHGSRSSLLAMGVWSNSVSEPIMQGWVKAKQILRWEQGLDEQGNKIKIRSSWMIVPSIPYALGKLFYDFRTVRGKSITLWSEIIRGKPLVKEAGKSLFRQIHTVQCITYLKQWVHTHWKSPFLHATCIINDVENFLYDGLENLFELSYIRESPNSP